MTILELIAEAKELYKNGLWDMSPSEFDNCILLTVLFYLEKTGQYDLAEILKQQIKHIL